MKIVFISDYVCPYCLVAKEAMKRALSTLGLTPEIIWQPFELTVEPKPRVDTYHDEVRRSHYQVLVEPCRQLGLDMKLPPHVVPRPYTRLAFEGYYYALEKGFGDVYNEAMYRAYFIDEQDIGDLDVLCSLADRLGMDSTDYRRALENGVYSERLREANRHGRENLQVKHVPTIYIDGKEISLESYTTEEFVSILSGIAGSDSSPVQTYGCGPDGCSIPAHNSGCGPDGCDVPAHSGGCGPDGCSF